ncbi:predicted protein [Brucella sp. F5/99]|nr:predicted protein [Brucella sp. F5/99]
MWNHPPRDDSTFGQFGLDLSPQIKFREPMPMTGRTAISSMLLIAALSLTLAACGRKGPLELPPSAVFSRRNRRSGSYPGETEGRQALHSRQDIVIPSPSRDISREPL